MSTKIYLPEKDLWVAWVEDGVLVSTPILLNTRDSVVIMSPHKTLEGVKHPGIHSAVVARSSGQTPQRSCPGAIPLELVNGADDD